MDLSVRERMYNLLRLKCTYKYCLFGLGDTYYALYSEQRMARAIHCSLKGVRQARKQLYSMGIINCKKEYNSEFHLRLYLYSINYSGNPLDPHVKFISYLRKHRQNKPSRKVSTLPF